MVPVVGKPTRFQMIGGLSSGCKVSSSYYQSEIVGPLSECRSEQAIAAAEKLIVHADNAHLHPAVASQKSLEENRVTRALRVLSLQRREALPERTIMRDSR
jgi:hypothetical protein